VVAFIAFDKVTPDTTVPTGVVLSNAVVATTP